MECSLCKTQNVGKTKTFNISVNNRRSDKIDRNVFPEYCHFAKDGYIYLYSIFNFHTSLPATES